MFCRHLLLSAVCVVGLSSSALAAVQTRVVTYQADGVQAIGFLAYDDAISGPRPGVLVVHEWWGLNDYARDRARQLAKLGYVAFCADMYGDGKVTEHPQEAGQMATQVRANAAGWIARAQAALATLKSQPECRPDQLAAIGYCFGGTTALQLAMSGADLDAVLSFHGALFPVTADHIQQLKAKVVICHGAADAFIPEAAVQAFRRPLDAAKVAYEFHSYPGAKHGFTVPDADARGVDGLAYNPAADQQSWATLKQTLAAAFQ